MNNLDDFLIVVCVQKKFRMEFKGKYTNQRKHNSLKCQKYSRLRNFPIYKKQTNLPSTPDNPLQGYLIEYGGVSWPGRNERSTRSLKQCRSNNVWLLRSAQSAKM